MIQIKDPSRRFDVLGPLFQCWASLDANTLALATQPYRDHMHARGLGNPIDAAVIIAWTKARPELALAEAMANPEARWSRDLARNAVAALRVSPWSSTEYLELLARQPANRLRDTMAMDAIKFLSRSDVAAAEGKLQLLSDPGDRANVLADILGNLAERDPAAGLARLEAATPNLGSDAAASRLISIVLKAAASHDPASALALIDKLPDALHTSALGAVLVGWAKQDPIQALEWAVANGQSISDITFYDRGSNGIGTIESLLDSALGAKRGETLDWLRAQPPSSARDAMLARAIGQGNGPGEISALEQEIYSELDRNRQTYAAYRIVWPITRMSFDEAQAWIKQQPAGEERIAAVRQMTYNRLSTFPDQAESVPDAWTSGPDRDTALEAIAGPMALTSPLRAMSFIERISDPELRDQAIFNQARIWLARDPIAAKAWLATTPNLSADSKRVMLWNYEGH